MEFKEFFSRLENFHLILLKCCFSYKLKKFLKKGLTFSTHKKDYVQKIFCYYEK